jgi:hypothetical protein
MLYVDQDELNLKFVSFQSIMFCTFPAAVENWEKYLLLWILIRKFDWFLIQGNLKLLNFL